MNILYTLCAMLTLYILTITIILGVGVIHQTFICHYNIIIFPLFYKNYQGKIFYTDESK